MTVHQFEMYKDSKRHAAALKKALLAIDNCIIALPAELVKEYKPLIQIKQELADCRENCQTMFEVFTKVLKFKGVNDAGSNGANQTTEVSKAELGTNS